MASYTVVLPRSEALADGQVLHIVSAQRVATFNLVAAERQQLPGAPRSIGPDSPVALLWDLTNRTWLRL